MWVGDFGLSLGLGGSCLESGGFEFLGTDIIKNLGVWFCGF